MLTLNSGSLRKYWALDESRPLKACWKGMPGGAY